MLGKIYLQLVMQYTMSTSACNKAIVWNLDENNKGYYFLRLGQPN